MLNGPRKIILINSGRYDYAEVELAESLQIIGPNNTGKTTLINTLQFLYLDDLRTMNFGSYSLEQSLAYYFPTQYSYALFECLGVTGLFTVGWRGQSKAAGGDPERFCYFAPYTSDDFFNEKRQVREPREVNSRLARKQFRRIRSAQEHRELLLPPIGADGRGMGIVAMRHAERYRQFRESLKDLLSLSSITQDQMRDRLLTLADVRTDIPALDVRRLFGEDYDRIRRLRDGVTRFKKHEEQVRLLVQRFRELVGIRDELITRWTDLRFKRKGFEQAHKNRLAQLSESISAQDKVLRAWSDSVLSCNDQLVPVAEATRLHRVFSFTVAPEHVYELRSSCALIENPTVFFGFERLSVRPEIPLAIYGGGRLSARVLDWLSKQTNPDFRLLHLPDYDPIGLSEFARLRNRLGKRLTIHLPPNLSDCFARLSNRELLRSPRSQSVLARLRLNPISELRVVLDLIERHHAGLEQEALLLDGRAANS